MPTDGDNLDPQNHRVKYLVFNGQAIEGVQPRGKVKKFTLGTSSSLTVMTAGLSTLRQKPLGAGWDSTLACP